VRFPSRLDGNACIAPFEGRGAISSAADPIALTNPPPVQLTNVATPWSLALKPTPAPTTTTQATTRSIPRQVSRQQRIARVQDALPGHHLFTANDRESTGIGRFAPEMQDNQPRCLAVENEHQSEPSEPMVL